MKIKKALICGSLALAVMLAATGCGGNTNGENRNDSANNSAETNAALHGAQNEASSQETDGSVNIGASELLDEDFSFSQGLDENGNWQGITALNYVASFNHQALAIPASVHTVSEAEIQAIIDDMLVNHAAHEQITDRPVAHGDTINIDFVGSADGIEFEGGSTGGMGMYVTIGETQFIDDFLYQLIGHMPGTVVNVEVTFPEHYHEASLQGAEALFITPINYIAGDTIMPEFTDAFVEEHLGHFAEMGLETANDLIEHIQEFLQSSAIMEYLYEYLMTQVTVTSIPEPLFSYFTQTLLQEYTDEAMSWDMDLDTMLDAMGFDSVEAFIEENRASIESEARFSLILQAVAEDAGIAVTIQDVTNFFIENFGTEDFSMFEEFYGLPWLKQFIRNEKVLEYIREQVIFA